MATVNRDMTGSIAAEAGPLLSDGQRLDQPTFHELYLRTPEQFRAELIEGVVHVASPVYSPHATFVFSLSVAFGVYAHATPGTKGMNDGTTKLNDQNECQPDVALIIHPNLGGQTVLDAKRCVVGCPELVAEVSESTLSVDLSKKKRVYEAAGALEYVVVDLQHMAIFWFGREGDQLVDRLAGPDGIFRSAAFPGLWLDARAFLGEDDQGVMAALQQGLDSPEHAAFAAEIARRRADRH